MRATVVTRHPPVRPYAGGMTGPRIIPAHEAPCQHLDVVMCEGGDSNGCRCQWFKLPQSEWKAAGPFERAAALHQQAGCGRRDATSTSGLLAYVDGEPAGWVAVEPRTAYPRLRRARVPWAGRDEDRDDAGVWTITCLVVRRGFRRRGLARAMAVAAVDHARRHGATAVEGYPRIAEGSPSESALYVGTPGIFAAAGMTEVSRPTPQRVVMRIDLERP